MKIKYTEVYGFRAAIRGMRNPMNSWHKSDSKFYPETIHEISWEGIVVPELPILGPNDLHLFTTLAKRGPEHGKHLRVIHISTDLVLPRYLLTELDTYKIATTRLSCSTRPSTLKKHSFTKQDFQGQDIEQEVLDRLNNLTKKYKETKNKKYLIELKRKLPEGYLQRITFDMNYQNALNIYFQRKKHWLPEWKEIYQWIETLPYMKDIIDDQ